MEPIELVALAVAITIIIKIIAMIAFPKHMRKMVKSYFSKKGWHNYWSWIWLFIFLGLAYLIFTTVPVSHITATLFLFGMYLHLAVFLVFPKDVRKLTEHALKDPGKLWLAISFSLFIAIITIYAVLF
jgi:hypothetical protein